MSTIPSVYELKGQARALQEELSCKLSLAQQKLASQHGFRDWAALSTASKNGKIADQLTKSTLNDKQKFELPKEVVDLLRDQRASAKPEISTIQAFETGLLFAFDIKEGQDFRFDEVMMPDEHAIDICSTDIAPVAWNAFMEEYLLEAKVEVTSPIELQKLLHANDIDPVEIVMDSLSLVFVRYAGEQLPTSFEDAYALSLDRCFWHPIYMWFQGKFINLEDLQEIRVRGTVVKSTLN
jgi:hypothetical protein